MHVKAWRALKIVQNFIFSGLPFYGMNIENYTLFKQLFRFKKIFSFFRIISQGGGRISLFGGAAKQK